MILPKIDNANLWDKTYVILKERIVRRMFKPNEKLLIPDLARQLGVSRTPIRDAINRLEMEGLVRTVSKVGTFVNGIDEETILDIMDTRLMLEYWVIEKLPGLDTRDIAAAVQRMEAILQRAEHSVASQQFDSDRHADLNMEFHLEFIRLSRNRKNIDMYKNMMNYRTLAAKFSLISKEMVETALEQHHMIVRAIQSGDRQRIREIVGNHLDDAKQRLLSNIKENGGII